MRLSAYPRVGVHGVSTMDHAAAFGVVRWTNLHHPSRLVGLGDVVGGELRDVFGPGLVDVDPSEVRGRWDSFSHAGYRAADAPPARLAALQAAVDILDA